MNHKFVVIDEIMEQLEAAKSGVVPGSVTQAIVSGINNVPANIIQSKVGGSSGSSYTTFPLSPIVKNCCLDKTYINLEFDINYDFSFTGITANKEIIVPFYLGFRDTATIFNQIQVLIENSALFVTTYQREEATQSYAALPETEINGNNQYASIRKMRENKYCPMKRVIAKIPSTNTSTTPTLHLTTHFKCTVDLNRLTPLLSNLHFTTPHMGNLRLKVFIQDIEKALFFCPDYNIIYSSLTPTRTAAGANPTKAEYENLATDVKKGLDGLKAFNNQYWSFYPLAEYFGSEIEKAKIPFFGYNNTDKQIIICSSIVFQNPTEATVAGSKNFMTFSGGIAEIVQTCFDIKDEEYARLTSYFTSLGSVIIPTQTWATNVFNNSEIDIKTKYPQSQIGTLGGYNVNFVNTWNHPTTSPCCLNKEFLDSIQLILDGRPINAVPYDYINDKCVVDCTQSIIDTDHEEINHDYISSLTFGNLTDTPAYVSESIHDIYGSGDDPILESFIGLKTNILENPNCFFLSFSTNLPDAFHSGACILENSNRQGVLRYLTNSVETENIKGPAAVDDLGHRGKFPIYLDHNVTNVVSGFSAFCDCCIVLTYDSSRQRCYDGQLSWAAPYE